MKFVSYFSHDKFYGFIHTKQGFFPVRWEWGRVPFNGENNRSFDTIWEKFKKVWTWKIK